MSEVGLHRMATRAASKLEDQMAALLAKMDKQSEQLENLARQVGANGRNSSEAAGD